MASPATNVQAELIGRIAAKVIWNDAAGNAFYRVYKNTINDFGTATLAVFGLQGDGRGLVGGLDYSTDYWFWVVGEDAAGGLAAEAGPATITTKGQPPSTVNIDELKDALYDWAYAVTGQQVILDFEDGTKPDEYPFVSLNLIGPRKTGFTDHVSGVDAGDLYFVQSGMRAFTVSVNAYDSDDAQTTAHNLQKSLDNPVYLDQLRAEGIGVGTTSEIRDLSQLLDTQYERRAQFEFTIFVALNEEITLDVIENVEYQNNI